DALLGVRLPEIRETLAAALSRHDVPPEQIAGITAEFAETLLQRKPARHDVTGSLSSSTLSSRIAKHLDLMGGAMSIDAGLQSPAAALIAAADLLHSGTNDLVICAVGQDLTDVAFHEQLAAGRKPGFLPGTGAAAIVLKRVADARRDGDTIHSVLPADVARRLSSDAARRTPGSGERCNVQPASNNDVTSPSDTAPGYPGVLAVERETLERSIIEAVVEQTALPHALVGPRSHLRNDLGFDAAATRQLLREFRVPETTRCETVRQLVDAALGERAGSPVARQSCEPDSEATALRRFVLRTVELPLDDAAATPAFAGPALILGDNPAATALAERLAGMDVPVIIVPAGDTRAALRELERICAERLPAHLFLMTGRDETGDERLPVSQLLLPVLVCRRWLKGIGNAKLFERASLVAVTMLGGDYGFLRSADSRRPLADGGVCGLLKSLHAESPSGLTVRIVDAPANEPPKMIAAAVCRELASNAGEIETASVRGKRHVIRAVPQSAGDLPRREVARDTHWIVTGGDATSLGRELERRLGITAHAIDSHLTDRRSLADRLTQIRSRGPIAGIICGPPAGELQRAAFPEQSEEAVERGLRERIEAAELLLELTADDPLTHILVMGCCGRFGVALRTLESAVDDGLAKLTAGFANRHADCRAIFAHCPGITDDRTIAAVIDELQIDSRETEFLLAVPSGDGDPNYVVLPSAAECAAHDQLRPHVAAAPLIEECFAGPAGGIAEVLFDPAGDPFLTGHLDDGTPLLPAVAGIETCAQAASVWSKGRIVSALRDQQIPNGFRMARPGPHRARVLLSGSDEETTCRLVGDFYDKNGRLTDPFRLYQTCVIELADSPRDIPRPDFGPQPADDWADVPYPEDWRDMVAAESGTVFYGPQLRTLKSVRHRPDGSWGRMIAPPTGEIGGDRRGARWLTPAALLDGALFLCDLHAVHNFGTRQLPQVIDRIDFGRLPEPGEECTARVLFRGRDGRRITWDFWVLGRDGSVILATHGFHVVTLR
ncbi:MAG: polyketide synthase dehydratase domain-containing protein, partial [Planctomycetaceae bacterium]